MKENYYLDDGTYSASQIVIIMVKRALEGLGKDIYSSLLKDLKEPVESSEFRLKLKVSIKPLMSITLVWLKVRIDSPRYITFVWRWLLLSSPPTSA